MMSQDKKTINWDPMELANQMQFRERISQNTIISKYVFFCNSYQNFSFPTCLLFCYSVLIVRSPSLASTATMRISQRIRKGFQRAKEFKKSRPANGQQLNKSGVSHHEEPAAGPVLVSRRNSSAWNHQRIVRWTS